MITPRVSTIYHRLDGGRVPRVPQLDEGRVTFRAFPERDAHDMDVIGRFDLRYRYF
ncbi:MAG: hypothetical protein ACI9CA_001028 [Natronomonas sp.]|jgi:hypothetical protein